ncbi:MAG: hypothetical protein FD180_2083 [Planctomycetota bacterium]|nr:MAG: hypothetical protein FD180_2083 [Planctomycetota bacterium]
MAPLNSKPETQPRVAIRDGLLHFNGRAVVPFGGEVQYFRNRDPHGDPERTHEIWQETLDRMAAAGMNHVTTYIPWDWHEEEEGKFRWDGDRDLDKFLALAYARGFIVGLKPGPFITAEWPRGFGSFGAVPSWFRKRHPGALARTSAGRAWTFDPLGGRDQTQPRYDAPEFLAATKKWFSALAPLIRRYVVERPCVAILQLDNETNLWWTDLAHVEVAGGYEERQEHCRRYLADLKWFWHELGIEEGDVLFTTNDSPFAIPGRHNVLTDGPRKSSVALLALDVYPKGIPQPLSDAPTDQPFQAPFFARLFECHSKRDFLYAAEIQAMHLKHLLGLTAQCDPRVTGQLLAQLLGSGLKGGSLYVMREGLNGDGTLYGPAAPIAIHGDATARWDVVAKFARFVARHGMELARSPHESRVAVVTHRSHAADPGDRGRVWSIEGPGAFAWLRFAGYDPAVLDLDDVEASALERFAAIVCVRPDLLPPEARIKLEAAAAGGSTLVELASGEDPRPWGPLLAGSLDGLIGLPSEIAVCSLPGASGPLRVHGARRRIAEGGEVFLRGPDGEALGADQHNDWGRTIRIGASFTSDYDRPSFYDIGESELRMRRDFAHALLGVEPGLMAEAPRVEAWRRGRYAFLVNHGSNVATRVDGFGPCRCAFTGERRDPARVVIPELGWAVLRAD